MKNLEKFTSQSFKRLVKSIPSNYPICSPNLEEQSKRQNKTITKNKAIDPVFKQQAVVLTSFDYFNYGHTGCIEEIPEGYYLNDTNERTIDKCPIHCKNCTKESLSDNMCISCNNENGYYEIFNEIQNIGFFIKCSNEIPEGYFLDNDEKKIKKCYPTCKTCDDLGNTINNKCTDCNLNNILINENCYEKCEYYYFFNFSNIYQCTIDEYCPNEYNKLIEEKKTMY